MKNKKELLKNKKMQLALITLCGVLTLSGCGTNSKENNNENEPRYYLITYNMDNAIIFEMDEYYSSYNMVHNKTAYDSFAISSPYIIIENQDDNSKEYAYEVAKSLVGQDGNVTFMDSENQIKLTK